METTEVKATQKHEDNAVDRDELRKVADLERTAKRSASPSPAFSSTAYVNLIGESNLVVVDESGVEKP